LLEPSLVAALVSCCPALPPLFPPLRGCRGRSPSGVRRGPRFAFFCKRTCDRVLRDNPGTQRPAALDKLVQTYVNPRIEQSPSSFATALADMDALANRDGIPHTFMTITMNKTGVHRAQEYSNFDTFLTNWCIKSWKHAPVELGKHFIAKWQAMWYRFCLAGPKLLGNIKDFAIRYETQSRGSLHVHVIIWNTSDAEASKAHEHITSNSSTVMHDQNNAQSLQHVSDPLMQRLAIIMLHKNQHSCRYSDGSPRDCVKRDGTCSLHFPVPIHTSKIP
jgi:hypothetical protein